MECVAWKDNQEDGIPVGPAPGGDYNESERRNNLTGDSVATTATAYTEDGNGSTVRPAFEHELRCSIRIICTDANRFLRHFDLRQLAVFASLKLLQGMPRLLEVCPGASASQVNAAPLNTPRATLEHRATWAILPIVSAARASRLLASQASCALARPSSLTLIATT